MDLQRNNEPQSVFYRLHRGQKEPETLINDFCELVFKAFNFLLFLDVRTYFERGFQLMDVRWVMID